MKITRNIRSLIVLIHALHSRTTFVTGFTAWCLFHLLSSPVHANDNDGIVFFEKQIRPLLVSECYSCHSKGNKIKGGLRLDWKGGWQQGGNRGPAIIPGQVGKSLIIQAIRHGDPSLKMPPDKKLTLSQIEAMEQWVASGAPDPRNLKETDAKRSSLALAKNPLHWAFQAIRDPLLPKVQSKEWPYTTIDLFIRSAQELHNLSPSEDADSLTLLRRIHFDLTGLPPTSEQMTDFEMDVRIDRPDAITRVIESCLASPHFGERWGRHWLDVARYSESTGGGRTLLFQEAWRYRDYVIHAFNSDKPYDQFVREQIAGDLIDNGTLFQNRQRLIATAFLLLGPTNYELQDKQLLEMDIIDEQIDTIGKAFLGLTIGCARCHDHKFDPILTRDYYAMAGIFKSTQSVIHSNVSTWNKQPLPLPPDQMARVLEDSSKIEALKIDIGQLESTINPAPLLSGNVIDDVQAKKIGTWIVSNSNQGFVGAHYLHDGATNKGAMKVVYPITVPENGEYEVRVTYTPGTNRDLKVPVTVHHRDGDAIHYVDQTKTPSENAPSLSLGFYFFLKGKQDVVTISNTGTTAHVIADAIQFLKKGESDTDRVTASSEKKEQENRLTEDKIEQLKARLQELEQSAFKQPQVIAVQEGEQPRDIPIAVRGNVHHMGQITPRGFIQALYSGPTPQIDSQSSGRSAMAEWLSSADNPLTARVFTNRVWSHLFGKGLVFTLDNFGRTGSDPTHPELLDHLAVRFVEQGWSLKSFLRLIMQSRVYQLASEPASNTSYQQTIDLENRFLWRQNRRRMEAESIRDAILSTSHQLDKEMYGATIRPGTTIEYGYQFEGTRRSLYTPVFRNTLTDMMQVFDFADPNLVTGSRTSSSVATQALFLMNSSFIRQQSEKAAQHLLAADNLRNSRDRIVYAFRVTLGRNATDREREILIQFLENNDPGLVTWSQIFQGLFASIDFRYLH